MLPELTGLTLEAAEAALRREGIAYTLCRTAAPFGQHAVSRDQIERDYAVRFEQGELTYASFPVLSMTDGPREGNR